MNGANARACQHGIGRFGDHRHVNRHAVALAHALLLQHIGETAHFFVKLAIGDFRILIRLVAFPDNRNIVAARFEMAVDAVTQALSVPSSYHLIDTSSLLYSVFLTFV